MVRLVLIAAAVFLAVYLLSRRFSFSQKDNDGEGDVVSSRSGGFLMAVIAVIAEVAVIAVISFFGREKTKKTRPL